MVFDTIPPILLQPLPRAHPPQLRCPLRCMLGLLNVRSYDMNLIRAAHISRTNLIFNRTSPTTEQYVTVQSKNSAG